MIKKHPTILLAALFVLVLLASCNRSAGKSPTLIPGEAKTPSASTSASKLSATPAESVATQQARSTTTQPAVTQTAIAQPVATDTSAPTKMPSPVCTPPPCAEGEVYYCAGDCPGGCGTVCATPTATSLPGGTPGSTTLPTPTFDASDPRASLGAPTWHESFDGSADWYVYEDERVRFQARDNKLEMTAFNANHQNGWSLAPQLTAQKFYLETTVTFGTCAWIDHFGVMLSPTRDASKGYLFGVSCNGSYVFWMWDGKKMSAIMDWLPNSHILAGSNKTNRIGIKVVGDKMTLYANGHLLTEITDDTMQKNYFGLFVGASETLNFTVKVSGMDYWETK